MSVYKSSMQYLYADQNLSHVLCCIVYRRPSSNVTSPGHTTHDTSVYLSTRDSFSRETIAYFGGQYSVLRPSTKAYYDKHMHVSSLWQRTCYGIIRLKTIFKIRINKTKM